MSSTLENVLDIEILEILEMIEEQEEAGNIQLREIGWKRYNIRYEGDFSIYVAHESTPNEQTKFEDWQSALKHVKQLTIAEYTKHSNNPF